MKYIITVFLLLISTANFSQTSLYTGKNPYTKNYLTGDIIKVHVNNFFNLNYTGDWNENFEASLKLSPDQKNLPFLNSSEQSKKNQRQQKERQNTSGKLVFNLSGIVTRQPDGRLTLNAVRVIELDGKITQVTCTGIINEKKISGGAIDIDDIADLNLIITSKPNIPRDLTINETTQNKEQADTGETAQVLTKEQIRKYLIQHLQEILGALR